MHQKNQILVHPVNKQDMDIQKLIGLIDDALAAADAYAFLYYTKRPEAMLNTKKPLQLLRQELQKNPDNINIRVLRAVVGVGVSAVKEYEPSDLSDSIEEVTSMLWDEIPGYKDLMPLGMDFGKGDPI